jgi:hypothetical protein
MAKRKPEPTPKRQTKFMRPVERSARIALLKLRLVQRGGGKRKPSLYDGDCYRNGEN